jgi:hypothetical protein
MSLLRADSGEPTASRGSESTHFDTSLTARVLAGLFAAGATLALLTVALPHPARASELGLLSIRAYLVAALLLWRARRLPARVLSDRSYSSSMTHSAACAEIKHCAGTQFDPRVVKALLVLLENETERADMALAQL